MQTLLSYFSRRPTEIFFAGICLAFLGSRLPKLLGGESWFEDDFGEDAASFKHEIKPDFFGIKEVDVVFVEGIGEMHID